MNTSPAGIKFIACREAYVREAYPDGENGEYSEGFGVQDREPRIGDTISVEDALLLLVKAVRSRDQELTKVIKASLKAHEWDALASLYYQKGSLALRGVGPLFNLGLPEQALAAFMDFNSGVNGQPTPGHTRRRSREITLGLFADYGDISTFPHFQRWRGDMTQMAFPKGAWIDAANVRI